MAKIILRTLCAYAIFLTGALVIVSLSVGFGVVVFELLVWIGANEVVAQVSAAVCLVLAVVSGGTLADRLLDDLKKGGRP